MNKWQQLACGGAAAVLVVAMSCSDDNSGGAGTPDLAGADLAAGGGGEDMSTTGGNIDLYSPNNLDFRSAAPTLTAVNPALGPSTNTAGAVSLTLVGTAFGTGSTVYIGGNQATVTAVTPTQLTVTLPPKPGTRGLVDVEIKNDTGLSVKRSDLFSYYYGDVKFDPAKPYTTASKPVAVLLKDMTSDGLADAVVINQTDATVQVFKGASDGTFTTTALANQSVGAVSYKPYGAVTGDINGDGKTDVITVNFGGDKVSLLTGTGTGTLNAAVTFDVGKSPQAIAGADVNKDTFLDVVTANSGVSDVSYLGGKSGGFNTVKTVTAELSPSAVAFANMDDDTNLDLVVVNYQGFSVNVFKGDGAGNFTLKSTSSPGMFPREVAVADFDGDGKLDVATSLNSNKQVAILFGKGDGTFDNTRTKTYTVGDNPVGLAVTDFNGDGKSDLVVALNGDSKVAVLLSSGNGGLATTPLTLSCGLNPRGVAAADLNNDGRPDIVTADETANTFSVLLNKAQ